MSQELIAGKFKHMFRRFDVDGSGSVNRADFEKAPAWIAGRLGHPMGSPVHKKLQSAYDMIWGLIAGMDSDGDGDLSEAEWIAGWSSAVMSGAVQHVVTYASDLIFECVDTSGDGKIGLDEYSRWLCAHGATMADAGAAFPKLDYNGDGAISKAEMRQNTLEFFAGTSEDARGNWLFGAGWLI